MKAFNKGKYSVRFSEPSADFSEALELRRVCFGAAGGTQDRFDTSAVHVLVTDLATGSIVATFRMSILDGALIHSSYAAQFYDLSALEVFQGKMLELGRFCIHPEHADPDILRLAWAVLTVHVDENGIEFLFGCSSFEGATAEPYRDAFSLLKARYLAPDKWMPLVKAKDVHLYFEDDLSKPDMKKANANMPSLLRTYLAMGGWVSDHAVVDHEMDTLHVFTGLEISAIPQARKKLLRALV